MIFCQKTLSIITNVVCVCVTHDIPESGIATHNGSGRLKQQFQMGPSFHSMWLERFGGMGCWYCSKFRFCLSHCYDDEEQESQTLRKA